MFDAIPQLLSPWLGQLGLADSTVSAGLILIAATILLLPSHLVSGVFEIVEFRVLEMFAPLHRIAGALFGVSSSTKHDQDVLSEDDDEDEISSVDGRIGNSLQRQPEVDSNSNQVQRKLRTVLNNKEKGSKTSDSTYTVPGLWNSGGNTCFLNSTLQAMASLDAFRPFLKAIIDLTATFEEVAPVSQALLELFDTLNAPSTSQRVYKPIAVVQALANSSPSRRRMLNSSDQQDAQEFYLFILAAVTDELDKYHRLASESLASLGIGSVLDKEYEEEQETMIRNPVLSLHANRIACTTCGYSEATRHLPSDYLGLNAPYTAACELEDMLEDFSKLEVLDEYNCRRCSIQATLDRLRHQSDASRPEAGTDVTPSKKKRMREVQKQINRLKACLDEENVEKEFAEPRLERALRPATKQCMFSRPADALVIHISRSTTYSRGGMPLKNTCRVAFRDSLDLSAFCTTSRIRTVQHSSMPTPTPLTILESPSASVSPLGKEGDGRVMYRLCSLVVHFGLHNYGHYITYRSHTQNNITRWFRISDETVNESSREEVMNANPFLLFYERQTKSTEKAELVGRSVHRMQSPAI